jgi:hypothetical protein
MNKQVFFGLTLGAIISRVIIPTIEILEIRSPQGPPPWAGASKRHGLRPAVSSPVN